MNFAGLDIGTTTISGILVDTDTGLCIETITAPNTARLTSQEPWEDLQDPEHIFTICQEILGKFLSRVDKISGLGLTGQMHGILYIDSHGQSLSPLFTWQDGRGDLAFQESLTYAEHLSSLTGYPMATGFGLTTHYYNLKNNLVPQGAVSIASIPDYIAMWLSGLTVTVMHPSMAHSLGLFDLPGGHFDPKALKASGIVAEILPQVAGEENFVGRTLDDIPVAIPIGDNQASFRGAVKPGTNMLLNIGTGSQISVLSETFLHLPPLEARPYIQGKYLMAGSALCGGAAYSLLRDFFAQILHEIGKEDPRAVYEMMASLGERAYPKEKPLNVDTRFKGTRSDPHLRGAIHNIGTENFTPGDLVVGFLSGMVDELKAFYDHLPEALRDAEYIAGSGNAVRRNALLRRIIEDQFGKGLRIPAYQEEAAMGAALVAQALAEQNCD